MRYKFSLFFGLVLFGYRYCYCYYYCCWCYYNIFRSFSIDALFWGILWDFLYRFQYRVFLNYYFIISSPPNLPVVPFPYIRTVLRQPQYREVRHCILREGRRDSLFSLFFGRVSRDWGLGTFCGIGYGGVRFREGWGLSLNGLSSHGRSFRPSGRIGWSFRSLSILCTILWSLTLATGFTRYRNFYDFVIFCTITHITGILLKFPSPSHLVFKQKRAPVWKYFFVGSPK